MNATQDGFHKLCRDKGIKLTPQRWLVYETLMSMHGHPSVEGLYEKAVKKMPTISVNTVYTTLAWLEENGFASSVPLCGSAKRYDTTSKKHHHLVCIRCGGITDYWAHDVLDILPHSLRKKFKVVGASLTINIVCDSCADLKSTCA